MKEKMTFLPKSEILTLEEIERLCDNFIDLGVEKIRLTGGEPLVRKNIIHLIQNLNKKKSSTNLKEITLTTNGSLLKRYAKDLKDVLAYAEATSEEITAIVGTLNASAMKLGEMMYKESQDQLEQDMAPFGFVINGLEDDNIGTAIDEYGTRWSPVVRQYDSDW